MAVIAVFELPGVSQEQYEASTDKVSGGQGLVKSPSDWPVAGLLAHLAGPTENGWLVVDAWDSEESFKEFGGVIGPILQELGISDPQMKVIPAFNIVTA